MGKNKKINIGIVVISAIATFLQTLIITIEAIYKNVILQIISAVLNAVIVALESVQLKIKKIKSRRNSEKAELEVKFEVEA